MVNRHLQNNLTRFFILMSILLLSNNVFSQQNSVVIEVNKIRFKTQKLQDLITANISEFKKLFNQNPETVTLDFFEIPNRKTNDNGEIIETKMIKVNIELNVNKYTGKSDWDFIGDKYSGATIFEGTTILLLLYNNTKLRDELFFFIDEKKIPITINFGGNMTFLIKSYSYENRNYTLIDTLTLSDFYKN